jgi:hypothetical protein
MEERLDGSYLRAGLVERAAATGITCVSVGAAVLLRAWGVSFLWRYTPPEIAVRIANPEVRVAQSGPLTVTQDKPFAIAQPEPLKIDGGDLAARVEQLRQEAKTAGSNVISREVTVFSNVTHGSGLIVTGWSYRDGSGRQPVRQYCYFTAPAANGSSTHVDLATDGVRVKHRGRAGSRSRKRSRQMSVVAGMTRHAPGEKPDEILIRSIDPEEALLKLDRDAAIRACLACLSVAVPFAIATLFLSLLVYSTIP